jgi:hypothetical protein
MSIAVTVVALGIGAQWAVSQTQFNNVEKLMEQDRARVAHLEDELKGRVALIEARQVEIMSKMAHDPVEAGTFQAIAKATDDKINLLQGQMVSQVGDLNAQVAALLRALTDATGANLTRKQQ